MTKIAFALVSNAANVPHSLVLVDIDETAATECYWFMFITLVVFH